MLTKKQDKPHAGFADRLHQAFTKAGLPDGRARVSAVARRFAVTSETARLWLNGATLPETARLFAMADELGCSLDWLALGRVSSSSEVRESGATYTTLTREERAVVGAMRRISGHRRAGLLRFLTED